MGDASVKLHALVVLNVSDHATRTTAQLGTRTEVFGALFGTQKGREVEIMNSFELLCSVEDGVCTIDREYMEQKSAQFKEVFKTLDLLGWYTTAPALSPAHHHVQRQIMAFTEMPLAMVLNPTPSAGSELPIAIYESVVEVVGSEQQLHFKPLAFDIATEEAERIGVEHVAQMLSSGLSATTSEATAHLTGQYNAIAMLHTRLVKLLAYLKDVEQGTVPPHHATLRAIRGLLSRLPVVDSPHFAAETMRETNDVLLMSYLAALTKSCSSMNDVIERVSVLRRARYQ